MTDYSTNYVPFQSYVDWRSGQQTDFEVISDRIKTIKRNSKTRFDEAVKFVAKAAAVDTGAIEKLYETDRGFTYAVAAQVNTIDFIQSRRGEDFATHFQDQMNAHEMIVDFATGQQPLVQSLVRQLHEIICASQETYSVSVNNQLLARPFIKGQYKSEPNTVTKADGTKHHYCPVEQVDSEMQRLLDEVATAEFSTSSGVTKAAYIHHCLTLIHPFSDGNGRLSRSLASVYLVKDFGIPLLIFSDQRDMYFDALEQTDAGNTSELTDFVYDRLWEAVNIIEENISKKAKDDLETSTIELKKKLLTKDSNFDSKMEKCVSKLYSLCIQSLNSERSRQNHHLDDLSEFMSLSFGSITGLDEHRAKTIEGYRRTMRTDTTLSITVKSKNPAIPYHKYFVYDFLVPESNIGSPEILLMQTQPIADYKALYVRINEIEDTPKRSLIYRLNQWAKATLRDVVADFNKNI